MIGPPFQPVLLAPFAALALLRIDAARLAWYVNLACLAAGLYWWHAALGRTRGPDARGRAVITWPLLAVAYPLQTNFEHQNINAVLLAVLGLAALRQAQGRDRSAGLWLGAAVALKIFPILLYGVLAVRRAWRTLAWATASAVMLTLLPVVRYGADRYVALLRDWWSLSGSASGRSGATTSRCSGCSAAISSLASFSPGGPSRTLHRRRFIWCGSPRRSCSGRPFSRRLRVDGTHPA